MTNNGYQFVEINGLGNVGVEAGGENHSPIRCIASVVIITRPENLFPRVVEVG